MPKYLVQGTYTQEGLQGLIRDRATGRHSAVRRAVESLGGTLESLYFSFGDYDVMLVADFPDDVTVAAISITVCASGLVRTKTTKLLTVEETDQALLKTVEYRPPGA